MHRLQIGMLTAGLVVLAGQLHLGAQPTGPDVVTYRPFTAEIKTTYLNETGAETVFARFFYRKADGSYAEIGETEAFGERGVYQSILDARERTWIKIDFYTKSVLVFPLVYDRKFRSVLETPGTCGRLSDEAWTRTGEGEMLGLKVIDIETPFGRGKSKRRVAPELECFSLLHLWIEKGVAVTSKEVVSLTLGDPEPAAFQIPSGFREVSPMQLEELSQKRFPGGSYYGNREAARLEADYWDAKAIRARERK